MKCAAAVMRNCNVRSLRLSIQAVNQAGTDGVAKETIQTGRPCTLVLPSTFASVTSLPHVGAGTCRVVDGEATHVAPGLIWSQRRRPITTAAAPRGRLRLHLRRRDCRAAVRAQREKRDDPGDLRGREQRSCAQ